MLKVMFIALRIVGAFLFLVTAIWIMYYVFLISLAAIISCMDHLWFGILVILVVCSVDVLLAGLLFLAWAWIIPADTRKVVEWFM